MTLEDLVAVVIDKRNFLSIQDYINFVISIYVLLKMAFKQK